MKIRNGFVSNSSSSSFIVAVKDANKTSTKIKIDIEIDLANYGQIFTNTEELLKHYKHEYGFDADVTSDDYMAEEYRKSKKAIEAGKAVIIGSFSSDSEPEEAMLCEKGLKGLIQDKNIEVIRGEGGY